ncbi:MAG: hypothetical protein NTZ34_00855 [Chloroflexi bacterium]|nr:hypothetical protein [Chloroflexota bacterium]
MKLALFLIPSLLLIIFAVNVADASDGVQPVYKLYAGDARDSENKPDIIAYANTEHTASPYDFTIEVSGKFRERKLP